MSLIINTEVLIEETPEKIWEILTSFKNYPEWNPFIKFIKGEVKVGNRIKVRIEPPNTKGMTFSPTILFFDKNKKLSWVGRLFLPKIFDGEHIFELIKNKDGTTTFKQSEIFKGILVPFFKSQLNKNTTKGFEQMNLKLKELAENNNA